jgi:bifunctional DNA-binding transcriptional regulator/antitoxin component of YhaV-PrlF toxin-antitoxin module
MKDDEFTFIAKMDAVGRLRIPKEALDIKGYKRGMVFEVTLKPLKEDR